MNRIMNYLAIAKLQGKLHPIRQKESHFDMYEGDPCVMVKAHSCDSKNEKSKGQICDLCHEDLQKSSIRFALEDFIPISQEVHQAQTNAKDLALNLYPSSIVDSEYIDMLAYNYKLEYLET